MIISVQCRYCDAVYPQKKLQPVHCTTGSPKHTKAWPSPQLVWRVVDPEAKSVTLVVTKAARVFVAEKWTPALEKRLARNLARFHERRRAAEVAEAEEWKKRRAEQAAARRLRGARKAATTGLAVPAAS